MNVVETFVKKFEKRSMNTVRNYRSIMNRYFEAIGKQPNEEYLKQTHEEFMDDIKKYWATIEGDAPRSRHLRLFTIKSFFIRNGIELKKMFFRDLIEEQKEKGVITQDNILTTEDIKRVLQHANEKDRAIIMVLATSGMRVGELLKLEEENIHLDHDPPYIYLPGHTTKNGYPRFTFITNETKTAVEGWQRVKKEYIQKVKNKNNWPETVKRNGKMVHRSKPKKADMNLLFPFAYTPIDLRWERLMRLTGLFERDKRTNRMKIHIHSLRSWAITRMLTSMPEAKANFIVGHTTYLSKEYNKFKENDIAPDYKRAMTALSIFEAPSDIREDLAAKDEKITAIEKENQRLRNWIQDMDMELKRLLREDDKKQK